MLGVARWSSGILSCKDTDIKVHPITFPDLVEETFCTVIASFAPNNFGDVNIVITPTVIDSENSNDGETTSNTEIDFQEIKLLSVYDLKFDIRFRIPFVAQATQEGAT